MVISASTASLNYLKYTAPPSNDLMLSFLLVTRPYGSAFSWQWRTSQKLCFCCLVPSSSTHVSKRRTWPVHSSMDGSRFDSSPDNSSSGPSRLVKIIKDLQTRFSARFQEIKNEFPMKLLFFLVGFYCATAFATVIGQTGDWDVLAAGLAVIVVEGIGALMYKTSFPLLRKIKSLISMFNYWKAGLTLGLFLDAFKYKIDDIIVLPDNPLNFDIDVFRYIGNPQASSETLVAGGWLRTGDLCYIDEDGFLFVVDRLKDLIKYNGYQVPSAELEQLLQSHPDIVDAAVIPYPDEHAGEVPMACVVKRSESRIDEVDVMDFIGKQVAPYKKIRRVWFVSSIPKSAAGKILRKDLRQAAAVGSQSKL